MKTEEAKSILRAAIVKYGISHQFDMAHEEMGELIVALHHLKRGKATADDVITEIADVTIMIYQLAEMFGVEKVQAEIDRKLKRLSERMNNTAKWKGVYKICPHCKSRMIRDDSKVYTSMPPQYGYNCPKCGTMEFDTVMYDNPEMEEQIIDSAPLYTIEQVDEKIREAQEWSEEDRNMLNSVLLYFNAPFHDMNDVEKNMFTWLQSLPEKFTLQPTQEWREEDEKMLADISWAIRHCAYNDKKKKQVHDWVENRFKSLRPQPKAELTLLDENIITAAVAFVEQNDHFNVWGGIDKHTVIKALRSLSRSP